MEPAKRGIVVIRKLLLVGLLCMVVFAIVFPIFAHPRRGCGRASCASNMKQLSLGLIMYAQNHEGRLPDAADFRDAVMPYVKNEQLFHCPKDATGAVSYSMVASLSGQELPDGNGAAKRVLVYEGTQGMVEPRHDGTAWYCFADGHVKAFAGLPPTANEAGLSQTVKAGEHMGRR